MLFSITEKDLIFRDHSKYEVIFRSQTKRKNNENTVQELHQRIKGFCVAAIDERTV